MKQNTCEDDKMEEGPIYVRIEEYRDVLDIINMIKNKVAEARKTLERIKELENEEDGEMERWENALDVIERKMSFIDKALFEPEAL